MRNTTLVKILLHANHDPLVRVGQSSSVNGFFLNDQHFLGVRLQYVCLLALQTGINTNDFNIALLKYYHQQQ